MMRRVLLIAVVAFLASAATTYAAWTSLATNPATTMTAATLAAPSSVTLAIPFDCGTANIGWNAATAATGYTLQRTIDGGTTWTDVAATASTSTSYLDAAAFTGSVTASYRVANHTTVGAWTSAFATSSSVTCSQARNLTATNANATVALAWSAATSTTGYDIERRTNGGSWATIATNRSGTAYTDATVFTVGAKLDYRVRAVSSTGVRGTYTNIATVASWTNTTSTGLTVTRVVTSDATTSYCASITVTNHNAFTVTWRTTLSLATYPLDGAVTSQSNVSTILMSGTDWTIGGVSFNQALAPNASATGSYCATRSFVTAPASLSIVIDSDHGNSYCATATVSTNATTPFNWYVTIVPSMLPAKYYPNSAPNVSNATTASFTSTNWVLDGAGWNDWVVAGTPRTFQWCASKKN